MILTKSAMANVGSMIIQKIIDPEDGSEKIERYAVLENLGADGDAQSYICQKLSSGAQYFMKAYNTSTMKLRRKSRLHSEITIQKSLEHPNILKLDHSFKTKQMIYLLFELCERSSFSDLLKKRGPLREPKVREYSSQLLSALKFLKKNLIIHRDLKLGNLFLADNDQVKITGFGSSARLVEKTERRFTICGSSNLLAPEILDGGESGHSFEVDIWNFGIILYSLTFGNPPFGSSTVKEVYRRVKEGRIEFPSEIETSEEIKALISSILVREPENRISLLSSIHFLINNYIRE